MTEFTEDDFKPGKKCPFCDEQIVTYFSEQVRDKDELNDDLEDEFCWVSTDEVTHEGLGSGFSGNVIIIDHLGPSMDPYI